MNRRFSIILACLMACAMLAGCGKKPEQTNSSLSDPAPASDVERADSDQANGDPDSQNAGDTSQDGNIAESADVEADPAAAENSKTDNVTADSTASKSGDASGSDDMASIGNVHITVSTVSVSVDQLKAQDYTVPVLVSIDKNPGVIYSEWGLHIDPKCTFTANNKECIIPTVSATNDEQHFIWTAWGDADLFEDNGPILKVEVKLPLDAKAGSMYSITYADTSLADKGDVWSNGTTDYAADPNGVTWTNGGVKVTS